jgi:hypothetical protein
MALPWEFPLHLQLPFEEKSSETVNRGDSGEELKRKIATEFGFEKDD